MKRKILFSACIALFPATAVAFAPASVTRAEFEACFTAQSARAPFQGYIAARQGKQDFSQLAGTIDGTKAPAATTPYQLASVGKVFTQVAIGQLVQAGRIRLDANAGSYIPDLPPAIAAVTIDQLLHHRSGIAANVRFTPDSVAAINSAKTARDLLPLILDAPLEFEPGSRMQYSNGGYFLLGAIIEAVSGQSYAAYLDQHIFKPMGMTGTTLTGAATVAPPMSRLQGPGMPPLDTPAPFTAMPPIAASPAGDAVSTAADMTKFGAALLGDKFLSAPTKAAIFTRAEGQPPAIGQAGGRPGSNNYFIAWPEADAVLVVLTNYDPPAGELMGEVLGGLLTGKGCTPLSPADRPSPMRILPPPGRGG